MDNRRNLKIDSDDIIELFNEYHSCNSEICNKVGNLIDLMEGGYSEGAIKNAIKNIVVALQKPITANSKFCALLYGDDNAVTDVYRNSSRAYVNSLISLSQRVDNISIREKEEGNREL